MRYLAIAAAYDGTLTKTGRLSAEVISALERLIASGRRAILVTRRDFQDIVWACPRLDLFEYVVAESGAVLHRPLAWENLALSRRRDASSASTVERALREMRVPAERLIGVGAEPSDDAFLAVSGLTVATAGASDVVKQRARLVTRGDAGEGVIELIDEIVRDDLRGALSSPAGNAHAHAHANAKNGSGSGSAAHTTNASAFTSPHRVARASG